jgi:hypothetical protein
LSDLEAAKAGARERLKENDLVEAVAVLGRALGLDVGQARLTVGMWFALTGNIDAVERWLDGFN